jgi:serine/threonine protein kinase
MPADSCCPDQPTLEKLLLGQLAGTEAVQWEEHLSQCSHCTNILCDLKMHDLLTESLRRARPSGGSVHDDHVVRDLIGQLRNLLPQATTKQAPEVCTPVPRTAGELATEDFQFLTPPQECDELGRMGQYRVLNKLGQGGMGLVFQAEDLKLHRLVALKVMLPKLVADSESRQRFLQEARAAAAVAHERVVTIYQVDEVNGIPFLAMQLLQGETLEARLRHQPAPYPVALILRLGREIAEGLEAAHRLGLVHRDVKPSNVWLQAEGDHVKVLDFGLARMTRTDARLTQSGMIVGTPGFLAPEQAAGRVVDARSDLFSLGVVLYLLATAEMPFQGHDLLELLTALAVEHPRSVFELSPALPEPLGHLIVRLLSKEADARPKSAREVIELLAALEKTQRPAEAQGTRPALVNTDVVGKPTTNRFLSWRMLAPGGIVLVLGLLFLFVWARFEGNQNGDLTEEPPPTNWQVVFRSDDPTIWNTDSPGELWAMPVQRVHDKMRYLRLMRLDTGEALILAITFEQILGAPKPVPTEGHWWNGTAREEFGARHLGIVEAPRLKWPWHGGTIALMNDGWDVFAGSGFGHKHNGPGKAQYYCWQGKEIPKTVFEIAVTTNPLSKEDQGWLVK